MTMRRLLGGVLAVLLVSGVVGAQTPPVRPRAQTVSTDTPKIAALRVKANAGDAEAQWLLGLLYANGQGGVPQDYAQGVAWYRKAAEQGYAAAQSHLGFAYANGQGVPQDYAQSVAWYRKAAEQGYSEAQSKLGSKYILGQGVPQDYVESYKWFNLAASRASAEKADSASFWSLKNDRLSMYLTRTHIEAAQKLVSPITAEKQKRYAETLDMLATTTLTPAQLADAQQRARAWLAAFEKRGGK